MLMTCKVQQSTRRGCAGAGASILPIRRRGIQRPKQHAHPLSQMRPQAVKHAPATTTSGENNACTPASSLLPRLATGLAASVASLLLLAGGVSAKTDTVKVGTCVLRDCQSSLVKCIGDPTCFKNLVRRRHHTHHARGAHNAQTQSLLWILIVRSCMPGSAVRCAVVDYPHSLHPDAGCCLPGAGPSSARITHNLLPPTYRHLPNL